MQNKTRTTLFLAAGLTLLAGMLAPVAAASIAAAPPMSSEITISARNNAQYEVAIAYNWKHKEYLVVWQDDAGGTGIYGQRVTSLGTLIGPSPIHIAEGGTLPRREPTVDYDSVNDRYLVVWMHDRTGGGDWDLSGRFIPWETSTPALPEFAITNWMGAVWHPEVAYSRGKQEFLIVAVHYLGGGAQPYIAGVRVYAGGGMHPNLLIISSGTEPCDVPDVAYSGTTRNEYLVTWDEWTGASYDVYAIRLDNNGNSLGSGEFAVANSGADDGYPAVAACNSCGVNGQYMVVWETVNWLGHDEIRRRFVSGTGVLDTWDYQVDTTLGKADLADVACNDAGQQYLVVWQLREQYVNSKFGILGTRVDTFGNVLDVPAFDIVSPGTVPADRYNPAVAAGPPPSYLVAWEHVREGTSYQDIHGRLVGLTIRKIFLPLVLRNK